MSAVDNTHRSDPRGRRSVARPRGVVYAFSAEPGKGSEPGGGWSVVKALAEAADLTVLVKSEHIDAIRGWEARHVRPGLRFVEVRPPVPSPLQKAHRITEFVTYLLWLRAAERMATDLHLERPFEFAYHATYSVYWLPTPATRMGIPSIWGPVGGGVAAPRTVLGFLGISGLFDEALDRMAVAAAALWPGTRRSWREASVRIVQNEDTLARLPAGLRSETHVLNAGELTEVARPPVRGRQPVVVFPSALISRKCPRLALEAIVHAPGVRLQFAHGGPQEAMLRRLARRLGVANRVDFLGKIPRGELFERVAGASAALFTGVREEGGLALAEALSMGTPVVVLSVGGARTLCHAAPDSSRVALVDPYDSRGPSVALGAAIHRFVQSPVPEDGPNLDAGVASQRLVALVGRALGRDLAPPEGAPGSPPKTIQDRPPLDPLATATGGDR